MTERFLDLSGKIDPLLAEILQKIFVIAAQNSIQFFIVGATARDIFFELIHNVKSSRATIDLDIGIHVATWTSYNLLMENLTKTGLFSKSNISVRCKNSKSLRS